MSILVQDVKYGCRMPAKEPGFNALGLTIGLAIGLAVGKIAARFLYGISPDRSDGGPALRVKRAVIDN